MPLIFQGFANNFLRAAAGIAVGGVEGVNALFKGQINYFIGFSLVHLLAENHRTESDFGDFEAGSAHFFILHFRFLLLTIFSLS